ncbi:MAG: radical SAM protein [Nitrososphaerales archaeon]
MAKECPEHGVLKSLICSNADFYRNAEKYNQPGKKYLIKRYATSKNLGCPWDCGLCAEHQQHTCVGLLEVSGRCDQNCPVCYASSNMAGEEPTLEDLVNRLRFLSSCECENPSLVITGGEPTLRSDLVDLVAEAHKLGYANITLNSNGVNLARNPGLAYELSKAGLKELSLSFDSLNDDVYQFMRGSNLLSLKKKAIDAAKCAGLKISLSVTVVKGVNDLQIGHILDFAKKMRIDGLIFTPIAFVGRLRKEFLDPLHRITAPDIIRTIMEHTNREIHASDFIPVPCPDSHCSALTYTFNTGEHLIPLTRYCDVSEYLGAYGERPKHQDPMVAAALDKLWSMSATPGSEHVLDSIRCCCSASTNLIDNVMSIQVHSFQDAWNFDLKRCMKCCIHVVLDDKLIPFCVYNNLYRR